MKRTQFYLTENLDRRLREAAAAEARSAAALVRDAVEAYLTTRSKKDRLGSDPLEGLIGAFEGKHPDASVEHDKYLYGSDK